MAPGLTTVPWEIRRLILQQISSPEDLRNLITASPDYFAIYYKNRKQFKLLALRAAVPEPLWSEFSAVLLATTTFRPITLHADLQEDRERVISFINRYLSDISSFDLPSSGQVDMALRLHRKIMWLIKDFTRNVILEARCLKQMISSAPFQDTFPGTLRSARGLETSLYRQYSSGSFEDGAGSESAQDEAFKEFQPSSSEMLRLYRAFLRFELSCRVFRVHKAANPGGTYNARDIHRFLFSYYTSSEVEEIASVHQFMLSIVRAASDSLDEEFHERVRDLAAQAPRTGLCKMFMSRPRLAVTGLYQFSNDFRGLFCGSQDTRRPRRHREGTSVSSGLHYMYTFAQSDRSTQFDRLRRDQVQGYDVLSCAMSYTKGIREINPLTEPDRGPLARPSEGYLDSCTTLYTGALYDYYVLPFRALGCVFWDTKRFQSQPFEGALNQLPWMNQRFGLGWGKLRYTRMCRPGPEEKLRNTELTFTQGFMLANEFGALPYLPFPFY